MTPVSGLAITEADSRNRAGAGAGVTGAATPAGAEAAGAGAGAGAGAAAGAAASPPSGMILSVSRSRSRMFWVSVSQKRLWELLVSVLLELLPAPPPLPPRAMLVLAPISLRASRARLR